jgi:hypothetical protein
LELLDPFSNLLLAHGKLSRMHRSPIESCLLGGMMNAPGATPPSRGWNWEDGG